MAGFRVIIVDDHPLFRDALRQALTDSFGDMEISEAGTLDGLSKVLEGGAEIDLVLLDLSMPGVKGFSGLMYLRARFPEIPVVVVSANEDVAAIRQRLRHLGFDWVAATGSGSEAQFVRAIKLFQAICAGKYRFTSGGGVDGRISNRSAASVAAARIQSESEPLPAACLALTPISVSVDQVWPWSSEAST